MKRYDLNILRFLMGIKLLATALVLAFPRALLSSLCPLGTFLPFFTAATAYADIPKPLMIIFIIAAIASTICLVVFSVCTIINRRCKAGSVILIICYTLETVSCIWSLFVGSFTFGKIVGAILNAVVVIYICKIWEKGTVCVPR